MFITIINDCRSGEDVSRLETRYSHLFPNTHISFVGVSSDLGSSSTLEAGGVLVDILDAADGQPGIIAMNVAPRGQVKKDGENGSKFCYFWCNKTLVVSTVKDYNLSLVKKLGLVSRINILDTKSVLIFAVKRKIISPSTADYINNSQFRSFDYQPRVARWLVDGLKIPHSPTPINQFPDPPSAAWLIDSFGNIKTTLTKRDLPASCLRSNSPMIRTSIGSFTYYDRLKLVPSGKTAIYTGSSGIGKERFLEIATQNRRGSAAKTLKLIIGDTIGIKSK